MSLPRLLAGTADGAPSLAGHLAAHGPAGATADLIAAVAEAGLRGRGGAGFPTAVKLRDVAGQRGPRCVLVNGAESEPMSAKDRTLMRLAPHLVLDGALAAARAVGAATVLVAISAEAPDAAAAMDGALAERDLPCAVSVRVVPAAHLAGEESALIRFLDGGPLLPTLGPPRPSRRGLGGHPTVVQNPETLAHLALIDRHGPAWFRQLGPDAQPGSALLTVGGAVGHPGVLEIAHGAPLPVVIGAAQGATEPLRAVLVGGYHGVWVDAGDIASVTLEDRGLAGSGGRLGAGIVVALGQSACPVSEVAAAVGWLADQSAGQCGPCREGLPATASLLRELAAGRADRGAAARLLRWSEDLLGRGACHLPDGAMRFLASGLRVFAVEIADHHRHGPCDACERPTTLRVPAPAVSA